MRSKRLDGRARLLAAAAMLTVPGMAAAQREGPPGFRSLPADEQWSDPSRAGLSADFKNMEIAPDIAVDLGGSVKERAELFDPGPGLVAVRRNDDAFLLHRFLLHANVRLGDNLRAFVEVEDARQTGRSPAPLATDANHGDVGQAFVEVTGQMSGTGVGVRFGRQEMAFGSRRLVGLREGANIRQRFDGVRGWLQHGDARLGLFAMRATIHCPGSLDDRGDPRSSFAGAHAAVPLAPNGRSSLDAYVYRSTNDGMTLDGVTAQERRQTAGLRWSGATPRWTYDVEGVVQWGRFGDRKIAASAFFLDTSLVIASIRAKPTVGVKLNRSSGGSDARTVRTFNPLFSRVALINESNLQTYSNLTDVFPYLTLGPTAKLVVTAGVDLQWRTSRSDGFYAPPLRALFPGSANDRPALGTVYNLQADWAPSANLSVSLAAVHYQVRGFLKGAGARDTNWVGIWSTFRF